MLFRNNQSLSFQNFLSEVNNLLDSAVILINEKIVDPKNNLEVVTDGKNDEKINISCNTESLTASIFTPLKVSGGPII